jgi:hypothetical protein
MSSRSEKKHSTGSSGSSGSAKMPKEAIKFAKRLGVDLNGFELEAEELWKKLDDMAAHRPVEYQAFMDQQYQYQMEEEANKQNPQSAQQQANNPTKKKQQQQPQFPQSSLFPSNANESAKYFRPDAGFCIQTHTTGGNDGLKIRGMGKDKKGKTLYINFCSHAAIDLPMDSFGTQVVNFSSANGLSVPLVVGPLRDLEQTNSTGSNSNLLNVSAGESNTSIVPQSLAVDVVFHMSVIDTCVSKPGFKSQIINLAFEWVKQETKVEFSYEWKDVTINKQKQQVKYVGGLGENGDTPVLFFVDVDEHNASMDEHRQQQQANANTGGGGSSASIKVTLPNSTANKATSNNRLDGVPTSSAASLSLDDPTSVLQHLRNRDQQSSIDDDNLVIDSINSIGSSGSSNSSVGPEVKTRAQQVDRADNDAVNSQPQPQSQKKPAKSLIKDLSEPTAVVEDEPKKVKSSTGEKKELAIRKGFLNGDNAGKLYPKGSNEGAGNGAGGSYARVMSKCQVVNMNTGSSTGPLGEKQYDVDDLLSGGNNSKKTAQAPPSAMPASSAPAAKAAAPAAAPPKPKPVVAPTQFEVDELNQLMESMDEEFRAAAAGGDSANAMNEDVMNETFNSLAKILLGPTPGPSSQPGMPTNQLSDGGPSSSVNLFDKTSLPSPPVNNVSSNKPTVRAATVPSLTVTKNQLPNHITVRTEISRGAEPGNSQDKAVITISGLDSSIFKVSAADISVTSTVINISMPASATDAKDAANKSINTFSASVGQATLDPSTVSAHYAKKKGVLSVTAVLQ